MPQHNLNNEHFTAEEKSQINESWQQIMSVLTAKSRNLNAEERQRYGSISAQNKLVVLKVLEYCNNQSHLCCPQIDYTELTADWEDRMFLAGFLSQMTEGINICNNIRITHDWDAYQAASIDYKHAKYMMELEPGAGFEGKYNDLRAFFTTNPGKGSSETSAED